MANDPDQDNQSENGTKAVPVPAADSISANMAGWFGVALTLIALAAFVIAIAFTSVSSLGFAALTGTGVLALGLISLIVLSRAVGVTAPAAALGLPPGSIRALLALGLAIVFVSVASWTLGGLFDPFGRLLTQVTVSADQLENYRKWYPESDYVIAETQVPAVAAAGAAPSEPKSNLKIYLKKVDPNVLDLAKQILTISATVLVTVVGFYFGSNTSAEAVRGMNDTIARLQGGSGTPGDGSTTPPKIDDLQQVVSAIGAIATATNSKLAGLGDDPIAPLATAIAKAENKEKAGADLIAAQKVLGDLKKAASACATDAERAKDAGSSIRADMPPPQLAQAGDRLRQLLSDAHQANDDFEKKFEEFTTARDALLQSVSNA